MRTSKLSPYRKVWGRLRKNTLHRQSAADQAQQARTQRDLAPEEVRLLERIATTATRRYRFPAMLENEFQLYVRTATRTARICLGLITLLMFAGAPAWVPLSLGEPPLMAGPMHWIELGVMTPLFAAVCLVQVRHIASDLSEWLLILAFLLEVVCIEVIVHLADRVGYPLEPSLSVIIPVSIIILARMRITRCLLFVGLYLAIVVLTGWLWPNHLNLRSPTGWLMEVLLLSIALLGAAWSKLSFRRQWASNLLLELMAYRDSLTALPNRRALEDHYHVLSQALARGQKKHLIFALIDLDHFKLINDSYGHEYGDGVLVEVGLTLAQFARRPLDVAARVGGEEFALILHDCDAAAGEERLERLLQSVRGLRIEHKAHEGGVVTCSIGAAALGPGHSLHDAYRAADECLYQAKREGRDRLRLVGIDGLAQGLPESAVA
ncbi:MAG: diguanylate cyclase domain-containing protein [Nevskiales bacterium]